MVLKEHVPTSQTHGNSIKLFATHEHANNVRTVGVREFIGVLNGVEFRTRHNDFRLYMANRTSKQYHATEPIHFPDVSPEVLAKGTIDKPIAEMREWFKAWKTQDYRKYFKPVLCYLEGAWTMASDREESMNRLKVTDILLMKEACSIYKRKFASPPTLERKTN